MFQSQSQLCSDLLSKICNSLHVDICTVTIYKVVRSRERDYRREHVSCFCTITLRNIDYTVVVRVSNLNQHEDPNDVKHANTPSSNKAWMLF